MNGGITYNTDSLQTYNPQTRVGINTNSIRHTDMPNSIGDIVVVANASDSEVPTDEHPNKVVRIGGTIHGSTQDDLDARIDTFKGYFSRRNKNLDINYSGGIRRYLSMKTNAVSVERMDKALFATFAVELICKPFGVEIASTVITNQVAYTSPTITVQPTIGGTAPYQLPIATITINALTGAGDYIQLSNDLNGQQIILAGLGLAAGDVIVINAESRVVTLNDEEIDYIGTFLELPAGSASVTFTDGFTTRNVNILIEYFKRYM